MRPRKTNPHLPKYVQHRHGAFYIVRGGKWERLGTEFDQAEYERRIGGASQGLAGLVDRALTARRAERKLAPNTWAQYQIAAHKIKHMLAAFQPEQIRQRHVATVMEQLATTPNMANRVLSVMRLVFRYAVKHQIIDSNPALGVERCEEAKRTRLLGGEEFERIREKAGPRLQCVMDLLFLTGQRVEDVLQLPLAHLRADGIYFQQDKTEARLVVAWTPEIEEAVGRAKQQHRGIRGLTLFQGRKGKPVDYETVHRQWTDACKAAGVADAQLRDIRAMAATAIKAQGGNATALLGHKTAAMTERYLRDKAVPIVTGPTFALPLKPKKTA